VGIYDPVTNTYANGPAHGQVSYAFLSGVLMPNGKVCLIPLQSAYVGIYDPVTNTYANGPAHGLSYAFAGGVLMPAGKVLLVPYNSANIGLYHSGGSSPLADCLHPYYNKF
jgi:hypothetical protein